MANLRRLFQRRLQTKQDTLETFPGMLGDGSGNVESGIQNVVFVRIAQTVVTAICTSVPHVNDLPVIVGYPVYAPDQLYVLSQRQISGAGSNENRPAVAPHAASHEFLGQGSTGGTDMVKVHLQQFLPLQVFPYGTSEANYGPQVGVYPGMVWTGTAWALLAATNAFGQPVPTVLDLSTYVPTTDGKALFVLISVSTTGTLVTTVGSEVDIASLTLANVPATPASTRFVLAAVRLWYSQIEIVVNREGSDIVDLRYPMNHHHDASEVSETTSIHTDIAAEVSGLTSKVTPVDADVTMIEDSETTPTAFEKKKLTWANLKATLKTYFDTLYGTDPNAIHDNVAAEISAIADKATPVDADVTLIEDSASSPTAFEKKKVTLANLKATLKTYFDTLYGSGTDPNAIHDNVAAEITGVPGKTSLNGNDLLLIEDWESTPTQFEKKRISVLQLLTNPTVLYFHDLEEVATFESTILPTTPYRTEAVADLAITLVSTPVVFFESSMPSGMGIDLMRAGRYLLKLYFSADAAPTAITVLIAIKHLNTTITTMYVPLTAAAVTLYDLTLDLDDVVVTPSEPLRIVMSASSSTIGQTIHFHYDGAVNQSRVYLPYGIVPIVDAGNIHSGPVVEGEILTANGASGATWQPPVTVSHGHTGSLNDGEPFTSLHLYEQTGLPTPVTDTLQLVNKDNSLFMVDENGVGLQFGADNGGWTYLSLPLTSTAWDGDARSSTAKTLIDLSSVFGVPAGVKAVLVVLSIRDSGSAASADNNLVLAPDNGTYTGMYTYCNGIANDAWTSHTFVVPCDANGDIYFKITATGVGTMDVHLQIWGYLLPPTNPGMTAMAGRWKMLETPLTSTAWDGDSFSTTAKTLIDLSAVFGTPEGIKGVILDVAVRDSGAAGADCYLMLSPTNTANLGMEVSPPPVNSRYNRTTMVVPCDSNGDIYYQILATGVSTMNVVIQIWGYYYDNLDAQKWVYLQTPLTSTAWDASGESYSTTAKTLIDTSAVFGVPPGVKAIYFVVGVRDSNSAGVDTYMILGPTGVAGAGIVFQPPSVSNRYNREVIVVPCDPNGDVYYQINASGAGTFQVALQVYGYLL